MAFTAPPGVAAAGGRTLLSSLAISAGATTADFREIVGGFQWYEVLFTFLWRTTPGKLQARFFDADVILTSAGAYEDASGTAPSSGGIATGHFTGVSGATLMQLGGDQIVRVVAGVPMIMGRFGWSFESNAGSRIGALYDHSGSLHRDGGDKVNWYGGGGVDGAHDLDGIRLFPSAGDWEDGQLDLYGLESTPL